MGDAAYHLKPALYAFCLHGEDPAWGGYALGSSSLEPQLVLRTREYYADMAGRTWESGEVHYGVSLTVSKKAPRGTGTCIMQAASEYSKRLEAQRIVAVTRAPAFHRVQGAMSFDEYYNLLRSGEMKESLYFLFSSAGWQLVG